LSVLSTLVVYTEGKRKKTRPVHLRFRIGWRKSLLPECEIPTCRNTEYRLLLLLLL